MQDLTVQLVDGSQTTIGALGGSTGTVMLFWSNNCQWTDGYTDRVMALQKQYTAKGVRFVLINANDPNEFPQEAASVGAGKQYPMAYVMDTGATFAQSVGAFRTPHAFVFDSSKTLVYTGGIDDSPADPGNVQFTYLKDVVEALAQGTRVEPLATKAFGCRIKF